mgnify:CR=1 FL=1
MNMCRWLLRTAVCCRLWTGCGSFLLAGVMASAKLVHILAIGIEMEKEVKMG